MLFLLTAVPGSGKTLYAIKRIQEDAVKDNRQVYYSGIPLTEEGKKKLGWIELPDPEKWYELPAGAVIVIDECQRIFPPRRAGTNIPKHVSMFETHRHHGFDVWLITQSPKLLDAHIRELVNKHLHLRRIFGSKAANLYQWDCCEQQPNTKGAISRSPDKRRFSYPREIYPLYKSAEMHTHKFQMPRKAFILIAALILLPIALFVAYSKMTSLSSAEIEKKSAASSPGQTAASAPASTASGTVTQYPKTASEVVSYYQPVVAHRPESAPAYQEVARPQTFPRLAGCIKGVSKCTCYTQQATILNDVPPEICADVVKNGRFNEYAQEPVQQAESVDSRTQNPQQEPQQLAQESGARVITLPDTSGKPRLM